MKTILKNILLYWLLLFAVVVAFSFFSCKTTELIKEVTVIKIKDSTAIHTDTTWFNYHNPADSLKLTGQLVTFIDSLGQCKIKNATGSVESNKIKIKYIVRNDSIFIDANTKPFDIKIAQLNKTIEHFKEMYESYTKDSKKVTIKNWWLFWQTWMALGSILLLVTIIIFTIFKLKVVFVPAFPFITIVPKIRPIV